MTNNNNNQEKIDKELIQKETKERLANYVEAIEKREEEKDIVQDYIKDLYQEAKSYGFNIKAIRSIIKIRKSDKDKLNEENYLIELYKDILGINF